MTKTQLTIEHVIVTAVEAVIAYITVSPSVQFNKTVLAGAAGAALSAVYNVLRQSTPPVVTPPTQPTPVPTVVPTQVDAGVTAPNMPTTA